MAKPVILIVIDDQVSRSTLEDDIRRRYGERYEVVGAASGSVALKQVEQLLERRQPVALFLTDARLPDMNEVDFLRQAGEFFPAARRVMLTTYDDMDMVVRRVEQVNLDYYLLKPWDPPERQLYPALDVLLASWRATYEPALDGLRVIGHRWSPTTHEIRDFLARHLVPFHWMDIEHSSGARELLDQEGLSSRNLPLVLFPDGSRLVRPTIEEVAERLGLHNEPRSEFYDLIIIGAGPAGLAAGVYAASEGLHTVLIEREAPGGQAGLSASIENYPGFPSGLTGADLARRATVQVQRFGGELLTPQIANELRVDGQYRIVKLDSEAEICGRAVLIATGVNYRTLEVPGIDGLIGAGVYYGAAMSEGEACRNEDVLIVGGGNSAGQAAVYFSRYARQVIMLVRGPSLSESMSQYLIEEIEDAPNIVVRTHTTVTEVCGEEHLEAVRIKHAETGEIEIRAATTMFIFIGGVPHTDWLGDVIARNEHGYIQTGRDLLHDGQALEDWTPNRDPYFLETNIPGVFAAGDVRDGAVQRVASAMGEGAMAVSFVHQYLSTA